MKPTHLVILAAVAASVASFLAGRATAPAGTAESDARSDVVAPPPRLDPAPSIASALRRDQDAASARRLDDSPEAEMRRIIAITDPLERAAAWLDFVNSLAPHEFEAVVADFRSNGFAEENLEAYSILLTAWAKLDPIAALDYASANTGNPFARNTILTAWAASDPDAAIRWAEQNHDGEGANPWLVGVIRGLVASDPERATELMASMPYSEERGDALAAILPHMLAKGDDAAKAWAEGIKDPQLREGALARLAERLAGSDPEGTARWLLATSEEAASRAMDDVVSSWAQKDLRAATDFYEGLPAGDVRSRALRGLTSRMTVENPVQAAAFLDANAAHADDGVYRNFIWHAGSRDPALAADYIGRLQDQGYRDRTYRRFFDRWLERDFGGATGWLQNNPLPPSVADRINREILEIQNR